MGNDRSIVVVENKRRWCVAGYLYFRIQSRDHRIILRPTTLRKVAQVTTYDTSLARKLGTQTSKTEPASTRYAKEARFMRPDRENGRGLTPVWVGTNVKMCDLRPTTSTLRKLAQVHV